MISRKTHVTGRAITIALVLALICSAHAASKDDAVIGASGDRIWVGFNGLLSEINVDTHRIESTRSIGRFAADLVVDTDRAWVLSTDGGNGPSRITVAVTGSRATSRSRTFAGVGAGLAQWRGSIWAVVTRRGNRGSLVEFTPNLKRVRRSVPLPSVARDVAAWDGSLWIALDRQLARYDGRRLWRSVASSSSAELPFEVQPRRHGLWIGNYDTDGGTITRVGNSGPTSVASFPRQHRLVDIATNPGGGVWSLTVTEQTGVGSVSLLGTTAGNPADGVRFAGWPAALTWHRHVLWIVRPRARTVSGVETQKDARLITIRLPR